MVKKDSIPKRSSQVKASGATTATVNKKTSIFTDISNSICLAHQQYLKDLRNDQKLRLIDTFLAFLVVIGVFQFCFCLLGGSYPFNAFLGGFSATVGQFVLTVCLRLQSQKENMKLFRNLLPERSFAEYIFASLIFHFVLIHFIN